MLLDTGLNPALIRNGALRRRFHHGRDGVEPLLPAGEADPLLGALAAVKLALSHIKVVSISHLRNDHAGGLRHVAGRVPIHVQRAELDFGLSTAAERYGIFRIDFDDPALR